MSSEESRLLGDRVLVSEDRVGTGAVRGGGAGAGLLLYGGVGVDAPLQSIDVQCAAACVRDAVNFRSRPMPCPVQYLSENHFRYSTGWTAVYSIAVLVLMARCAQIELLTLLTDKLLLGADLVALAVVLLDISIKSKLFGWCSVILDLTIVVICLFDTVYIYQTSRFSYCTALRIYFVVLLSESTLMACRNSLWCLRKVLVAISVQMLSWFFFSCLCVVLFGLSDPQFRDLGNALVNMFALITTSNNPDVWANLYALNRTNVVLFLCYLFVSVFFLQNYVAVTIFSEFSSLTKESLQLRQQHRLRSLSMAFDILDKRGRRAVEPPAVFSLLQYMRPHYPPAKISILYDCIDPNNEFRAVSFERFCRIIDALNIRVSTAHPEIPTSSVPSHSFWYRMLFYTEPVLNIGFVAFLCWEGKRAMMSDYLEATVVFSLSLTVLAIADAIIDIWVYGMKSHAKTFWIYISGVEIVLSSMGLLWIMTLYLKIPPASSIFLMDTVELTAYVVSSGIQRAIALTLCGRCIAMLQIVRLIPHYRKVVYSCYAVVPGLLPMIVPLFVVAHVFAFVGMYCFHGVIHGEEDFGGGAGNDPNYGLFDFSSYTNSLIIIVNLLVVNNWVKLAAGLDYAVGSLWIYLYFMLFFVIGVTFCLLSLTSIFISSIMLDHDTNPATKRASMPMPSLDLLEEHAASEKRKFGAQSVVNGAAAGSIGSVQYTVSRRHQDTDNLIRILDSVSAPGFQTIMELVGTLMGSSIIVLAGNTKILYQNPSVHVLLESYTEAGIYGLFDDMVKDFKSGEEHRQRKYESRRVSDVINISSAQEPNSKVLHMLSGPVMIGTMKYDKLEYGVRPSSSEAGGLSPTKTESVRRQLQVRYCSRCNSSPSNFYLIQSSLPEEQIAVFVIKEISQATI